MVIILSHDDKGVRRIGVPALAFDADVVAAAAAVDAVVVQTEELGRRCEADEVGSASLRRVFDLVELT